MSNDLCDIMSRHVTSRHVTLAINRLIVIQTKIHPSSIFLCFSGAGSWGQQTKQGTPHILHPSNNFQLLLWDSKVFSGQMRYIIPPECSGSGYVPRKPLTGGAQDASLLDARTTSTGPFRCEGAAAVLQAPSVFLSSFPQSWGMSPANPRFFSDLKTKLTYFVCLF